MPHSSTVSVRSVSEGLRATFGRRAAGFCLAILAELLLVLLLLTMSPNTSRPRAERPTVFSLEPEREEVAAVEEPPAPPPSPSAEPDPSPATPPVTPAATPPPTAAPPASRPAAPPPPVIPLSRDQMAAIDLALAPPRAPAAAAPRRSVAGPPNVRSSSPDTPRAEGAGPNGEPLYAAAWYREPYPEELSGYLSTSRGPGWALIACRTVRDYRVEDCVALGEYPERSNIARSVLAAAWQFKVRPPRIGGESKVGEWVRIRIDYGLAKR